MAGGNKGLWTGLGIGCGFAAIVIVAIMVGCYVCADNVADTFAPLEQATVPGVPTTNAEAQIPWLQQARGFCAAYDTAPNDIQRSRIFQESVTFIDGKEVSARGTLDVLSTGHGGGDLLVSIGVGDAKFSASGWNEGDALYEQAATLIPGSCVEFMGQVLGPHSGFERDKVCELGYTLRFESIGACQGTGGASPVSPGTPSAPTGEPAQPE